jgi:hypothetical protein
VDITFYILCLLIWLVMIAGSVYIGLNRNRVGLSILLGLLLGPLGLIVMLFLPKAYDRICPECRCGIPDEATRCGHCGAQLGQTGGRP